jgi:nucleoside-diphosphate-sugar epimerase
MNRSISIFGDGKQIRDLLHVSDLIRAYELGIEKIDDLRGQALNIGGGPANTLSIWAEFGPLLAELTGREIPIQRGDWRPGDQRVFVAGSPSSPPPTASAICMSGYPPIPTSFKPIIDQFCDGVLTFSALCRFLHHLVTPGWEC